ncbi:aspartate aminotransferase family protein [Lactiplantibacillus plantarum]|uniref:aspartate aminotransferase family protein n=1 Tax=Lactiplantibacillus plantarum TaxID=1590 RepID=UPI003BA2D53D
MISQNHRLDQQLIEREDHYMATAARINYYDLVIDHAHGALLTDVDGNQYIDLLASASAINVGHTHPRVVKAIQEQAAKLIHYTPAYFHHQPEQRLAERLAKSAPGTDNEVVFGNSGSDANDAIIKFARAYTNRQYIVAYTDAYHGSTYDSMSLSGVSLNMVRKMGPLLPGIVHVPYPDGYRTLPHETEHELALRYFEAFKAPFDSYLPAEETACVIIEPIQGDGGIRKAPAEYVQLVYDFCHQHGILFAVDEVNQGMGRTGKMWSIQNFPGIRPDLMSVGKSLASGLPLSAVIGRREVMESLAAPAHTFTTAANPVCCAAALATIDVLADEQLVARSANYGRYAKEQFLALQQRHPKIGQVRMYGLNGGIELVTDRQSQQPDPDFASDVIYAAFERGVVMITLKGNILRFQPPLVITKTQLDTALTVLDEAMAAAEQGLVKRPRGKIGW